MSEVSVALACSTAVEVDSGPSTQETHVDDLTNPLSDEICHLYRQIVQSRTLVYAR